MPLSTYPGKCTTTFTHSSEPLILPTKSGPKRALPELCKDITPECYLNPFLFTSSLQAAWTLIKAAGPSIHYKRRTFQAEDPRFAGHFTVDFVVAPPPTLTDGKAIDGGPEDEGLREDPVGVGHHRLPPRTTYFTDKEFENLASEDTKPLLITLHGITGGSYEVYLRHVLAPLVEQTAEGEKAGGLSGAEWEALVVNSRGCAGSKITSSILYNARATWDVRQVVKWCRKVWPKRPLFGLGFSLGANILTNYLGEEGDNCLLSAGVVISNPWQLEVASVALQRSYFSLNFYSRAMGENTRKLFERHKDQITANTALDLEKIAKIKYLHEFDREIQCPTWGYPTEGAYYRDASSADSVLAVRTPLFCIHAKDDPIAVEEAVPYQEIKQNPYVVLCMTSGGGHLFWFELGGGRWHAKPAVGFLNAMAKNVDFDEIEAPEQKVFGPHGGHDSPFVFEAMRRKLHLPGSDQ